MGWSERVGSKHAGGQHVLGCARAGVPALGSPGASQDRRVLLEPARALCMAPPPPPSSTRQLTELKALLGLVGQSKYVLGFLSQPREGEYALEDLSARLPLDIQDAERTPGLFTGEGGVWRVWPNVCSLLAGGPKPPDSWDPGTGGS